MLIRTRDEIKGTDCELDNEHFHSFRLLYKVDAMGFSMTDTYVRPGPGKVLWYKNHLGSERERARKGKGERARSR